MRPPLPSADEIAHVTHRPEPEAPENLATGTEARESSVNGKNGKSRLSFSSSRALYSDKNCSIASLAILRLQGKNLDVASVQRQMKYFVAPGLSPEELIAEAIGVAEGPIGQAAKQQLDQNKFSGAWTLIASKLQYADNEKHLKQEMERERERYGPFPLLGKLLEIFRRWASAAMEGLSYDPEMPSLSAPVPAGNQRIDIKTTGIPDTPPPDILPPANRYSPEEWRLLQAVPWNRLADDLKIKTIRFHDDPACRETNPDDPVFPLARAAPAAAPRDKPSVHPETPPKTSATVDEGRFSNSIKLAYDPDELEILAKTPWMDLPVELKRKTAWLGHHPFPKILNSETPPFYPFLSAPQTAEQDWQPLAPPVSPPPKPTASDSTGAAKSMPLPNPPYLIVERPDILGALRMIHNVGQPRSTDQIIFSFDGACLHFDMPGMTTAIPAKGIWDCQIRAKPAFVLPLIQVPLDTDSWILWAKEGRLYFGPTFSCPCDLQDSWRANIQLPLNNGDDMLLALSLKYSAQEIEQSGLKYSVAKVEDLCMRNVHAAAQNLTLYGVKAEEIRPLINQHLRSSGILDKI